MVVGRISTNFKLSELANLFKYSNLQINRLLISKSEFELNIIIR